MDDQEELTRTIPAHPIMVTFRHDVVVSATFINIANTLRHTKLSRLFYVEESSKIVNAYTKQATQLREIQSYLRRFSTLPIPAERSADQV